MATDVSRLVILPLPREAPGSPRGLLVTPKGEIMELLNDMAHSDDPDVPRWRTMGQLLNEPIWDDPAFQLLLAEEKALREQYEAAQKDRMDFALRWRADRVHGDERSRCDDA